MTHIAAQFLQPQKPVVTQQYIKAKEKEIKAFKKNQRVRTDQLSPKERGKAMFLVTLSQHYIEALVDCTDELVNMKIIGGNHLITQARNEFLKLQNHFLKEAINQGEETFLARQEQQKKIEKLFESLHQLNIDQLDALINFSENIKFKK